MEAIVAVGLASNVVQFVDFTTKLVVIANELRNDAASSENRDHQAIATHLEALAQSISDTTKAISQASTTAPPEERALQPVADKCCELAKDLLNRLQKCGIKPGQNGSRFQRAKAAFKTLWNKKEIGEISNRLEFFRSELTIHYMTQIRKTQLDQQVRQEATTDEIRTALGELRRLEPLIGALRLDISEGVNRKQDEIINSFTALRTENSQLHTQAARQATDAQIVVLDGLHSIQSSVETGFQNIQIRQSETLESLAHVRVENGAFNARIAQHLPLEANANAPVQHVLRSLLEEYSDKILAEVKKEFRETARAELNNLLNSDLRTFYETQHGSRTARMDPKDTAGEDETGIDSSHLEEFESRTSIFSNKQGPHRHDRNSITKIYSYSWHKGTNLGHFTVLIRDRVRFDAFGRPKGVYELAAHFIPSLRWLSTGISMTYQNISDARGSPDFGLRLKTYRIISNNHEVWYALRDHDVQRIQSMLSQKLISTSDRNSLGLTPFHFAVLSGDIDACKALVQSGADINARDG
ncbi:hypothetical protein GGS26DRAFT_249749 [Hypomontagnella submonticulosa]|nr:hypothetical protein GGS26DRAFT_249749 [Hypomontagnella submonticulosa]